MTYQAILCGQRSKEVFGLIDIRNLSFEENFLVICIGDIMKTSNKNLHIGEIKFPRYRENDKICVSTCMREYLKLTANLRGNINISSLPQLNLTKLLPKTPLQDGLKLRYN